MKWEDLTTRQLGAMSRELPVVLNIAAIEQHGPHLPLATDCLIGEHFLSQIDRLISDSVLVLPQVKICCSAHHMDFDGTLTVRHETLLQYLGDILDSVQTHGFRKVVLFNSHGGNEAIGRVLLEKWGASHPLSRIFMLTWWRVAGAALAQVQDSPAGGVGHACEFETSLLQYFAPQFVQTVEIRPMDTEPTFQWAEGDMLNAPCGLLYRSMKEISRGSGVVGAPAFASREKGERISNFVTEALVRILRDIRESAK
jgi:creatinine amidohydrolase